MANEGTERAHFLLETLIDKARRSGAYLPYNATTAYVNTIPTHLQQRLPGNPDMALASMGIYVFNARFLFEQLLRDADDPKSSHDFGKDVIPHCVKRYRTFAQNFADSCVTEPDKPAYWRDVGTLDLATASSASQVCLQRRQPARAGSGLDGVRWLHHQRLDSAQVDAVFWCAGAQLLVD